MTLLTSMLERPLDPGYAAAARRRERDGVSKARPISTPIVGIGALIIGLVVTVAALRSGGAHTVADQARADLIARVETRQTSVDQLGASVRSLQADVSALEASANGPGNALSTRANDLAPVAGTMAVRGPGLTITLDDAEGSGTDTVGAGPREDTNPAEGRVQARDLQLVVNDLWRAGAQAVAVNGHRLTSMSAIRFAGAAIIVNYRPLGRPYIVTAIGTPKTFPAAFAQGPGGSYLATLRSTFNISVDVTTQGSLDLPASVSVSTRYATAVNNVSGKDGS